MLVLQSSSYSLLDAFSVLEKFLLLFRVQLRYHFLSEAFHDSLGSDCNLSAPQYFVCGTYHLVTVSYAHHFFRLKKLEKWNCVLVLFPNACYLMSTQYTFLSERKLNIDVI